MASATDKKAALNTLNQALSTGADAPKNMLSSVSVQLRALSEVSKPARQVQVC